MLVSSNFFIAYSLPHLIGIQYPQDENPRHFCELKNSTEFLFAYHSVEFVSENSIDVQPKYLSLQIHPGIIAFNVQSIHHGHDRV